MDTTSTQKEMTTKEYLEKRYGVRKGLSRIQYNWRKMEMTAEDRTR